MNTPKIHGFKVLLKKRNLSFIFGGGGWAGKGMDILERFQNSTPTNICYF